MKIYGWGSAIALGLVSAVVFSPQRAIAASLVLNETFDDASQFSSSDPSRPTDPNDQFFAARPSDYLGLIGGTSADFGGDSIPSGVKPYSGLEGSFLTGQDLDGGDGGSTIEFLWSGLNISGLSNLTFSGLFAESVDGSGHIDAADLLLLEYAIDGGDYQSLLSFRLDANHTGSNGKPSSTNGIFREDIDGDGRGEGTALGRDATAFTKSITGTGSLLDLRFTVSLNAGNEDFAVDNFRITGEAPPAADPDPGPAPVSVPEPGTWLGLGAIAGLFTAQRRRR